MGRVTLIRTGDKISFEVELHQPGTFTPSLLLDREKLAISLYLTPGASMTKPVLAETIYIPGEPTDDYLYRSQLRCTIENAAALLIAGFELDADAARQVESYQIPEATIRPLREEMNRLHTTYNQQLLERLSAGAPPGWRPPPPPWRT